MTEQKKQGRTVLHLLHAATINRGGPLTLSGGTVAGRNQSVEVIEDLLPLDNVAIEVKLGRHVERITLEPQGKEIAFEAIEGGARVTIDRFTCHQMVVFA